MSKHAKRGRPARQYQIRVRTERRDPIDYAKLAQAALEQAAMDQRRIDPTTDPPRVGYDCDAPSRDTLLDQDEAVDRGDEGVPA